MKDKEKQFESSVYCSKCDLDFSEGGGWLDFVSLFGAKSYTDECPQCGTKINIEEKVERTWRVTDDKTTD